MTRNIFKFILAIFLVPLASAEGKLSIAQPNKADIAHMPDAPVGELSCSKGLSTQVLQGTVVGRRDTLLTVAHILDGNTPEPGTWLKGCIFRMFDKDGRIRFASRVRVVSRPSESQRWSYALDWAILRLEKTAPVEPAQVADLHSALESGHHWLAYFSRNRGKRFLQIASRCSVRAIRPRSIVLKHDCPSWKGTSGSPLIARSRDGYRVFGIQAKVGGYAVGIAGWPLEELRKATVGDKGDTDGDLFPPRLKCDRELIELEPGCLRFGNNLCASLARVIALQPAPIRPLVDENLFLDGETRCLVEQAG